MSLRQLQQEFKRYILTADKPMLENVVSTHDASAEERLNIYSEAYRLRLLEALGQDYEGLHGLLGDEQFASMGRAYIEAVPSQDASIRWFGAKLADFLSTHSPYDLQPVLADMARFEWAQGLVFDGPDQVTVSFADLSAVPPQAWPELRLALHLNQQVLQLEWNIPPIWTALDQAATPPPPEQSTYPISWLLWRQTLNPHWRSLDVDEAWAFQQVGEGQCFGEICQGLLEWIDPEQAPLRAAGYLKQWVSDGLVTELKVN